MMVWSLYFRLATFVSVTVVCPSKVMALVIIRPVSQVAVPAGMITVSPLAAEFMAALTSTKETLRAVIVAALSWKSPARKPARDALKQETKAARLGRKLIALVCDNHHNSNSHARCESA